jgi:hypothetical protein
MLEISLKIREGTFRTLQSQELHHPEKLRSIVLWFIGDAIDRVRVATGDALRRELDPVEDYRNIRRDYRKIALETSNAKRRGEGSSMVTFEMDAKHWKNALEWIAFIGVEPFQFVRSAFEARANEITNETFRQVWLTMDDADLWSGLSKRSSKPQSRFAGDLLVKAATLPKSKQAKAIPLAPEGGNRWPVRFSRADLAAIERAAVKCGIPLDVWIYSNLIAGLNAIKEAAAK